MFFFQDDIGLLIQLQNIPFWQFLLTPQAEHFAPVLHLLSSIEYRLFHLNFIWYVIVILLIHLLNCIILGKIVYKISTSIFCTLLAISFFLVNLTYTEPFLWFAANGVVLSVFFLGLSFYFWYTFITGGENSYFWLSVITILLSGFSFGTGIAIGLVFALVTFIYRGRIDRKLFLKIVIIYLFIGLLSYFIGPIVALGKLDRVVPLVKDPFKDVVMYIAFIISGVSRGVVGRLILPGFEPRHFQIIPTIISFLPFIFICLVILRLLKDIRKKKEKLLFITLSIFITYPYIWSGFLRSHFGLKQALAERYAYPSLFFFAILLTLIFYELLNRKLIRSKRLVILFAVTIIFFQSLFFVRNAKIFEERPGQTRDYFEKLTQVLINSSIVLDLPLPSYINQEYQISQLASVIKDSHLPKFISPDNQFCTQDFRIELKKPEILSFYLEQTRDPVVRAVFTKQSLMNCLSSQNKKV